MTVDISPKSTDETDVPPRLGDETDGLASAYQRTQVTGAGNVVVVDTGGICILSVITLPVEKLLFKPDTARTKASAPARPGGHALLVEEMVRDVQFRELVERGLADLNEGRKSKLEDVKRRLGDI